MRGQIVRSWTKFILAECLLVAFVLAFCFFGITPVDHPYISKLPFSLSLFRPQTSRPAISSPFPRFYVSLPHEGVVWRRGGQTVGSDSPSGGPSSLINPTASGSSIIAIFHSQGTSAFSKVTSQTSENTASASPAINSTSESSANQIPSGFISSGANIPPPSTVQVTATVISVQTSTIQVTPLPQGPDIIVGSNIYPFDTITRTITQSTGGNIIIGPTEVVCGTVTIPLEATGTVPQALSCQGAMVTASPSPNYGNFSALANEVNVMMDNDEFVLLPFPFTIPRILPSASTVQQVRMSPSGVIIAGANMPIPSTLKGQTDLGGGIAAKPGGPEKRKKPGSSCKGLFGAIGCLVNTAKDTVEGAEGIVKDTEPFVKGTVDTVDHAAITNKLNLLDGSKSPSFLSHSHASSPCILLYHSLACFHGSHCIGNPLLSICRKIIDPPRVAID
ncbi:hypothetical protein BU16DRAFT_232475 [Lophium mytilinum]|uniref:Uncharacterized protein n=1 Tax=Lophium mytilinum TaxID=390894 RepID=A0A6A6R677_9PEZI|nr:hypothetical protein BU16DRAFT_232475 [Lophium mytilinum]